jgi:hypothetical protein
MTSTQEIIKQAKEATANLAAFDKPLLKPFHDGQPNSAPTASVDKEFAALQRIKRFQKGGMRFAL